MSNAGHTKTTTVMQAIVFEVDGKEVPVLVKSGSNIIFMPKRGKVYYEEVNTIGTATGLIENVAETFEVEQIDGFYFKLGLVSDLTNWNVFLPSNKGAIRVDYCNIPDIYGVMRSVGRFVNVLTGVIQSYGASSLLVKE